MLQLFVRLFGLLVFAFSTGFDDYLILVLSTQAMNSNLPKQPQYGQRWV